MNLHVFSRTYVISLLPMQVLFGVLLLVYIPDLDPYPGYSPLQTESVDNTAYEELPGGEQVCPERRANIFSSMLSGVVPMK